MGGKLKLKGGVAGKPAKKKKAKAAAAIVKEGDATASKAELDGYVPPPKEDTRTEAEKRFEAKMLEAEEQRLAKLATMSHRDRVREFNDKLASMSEHHDIPRVGPG